MDIFVEDLKASVEQARWAPEGKGDIVSLYGTPYFLREPQMALHSN